MTKEYADDIFNFFVDLIFKKTHDPTFKPQYQLPSGDINE